MRAARRKPGYPDPHESRTDGLPFGDLVHRHNPQISRYGERFRTLYKNRVAVEREFGMLKNHYGLLPLRVRGLVVK